MRSYELELNGETLNLRLASADCVEIEKKTGKRLLDLIQDYSITTIIMFLKYMLKANKPNISDKDAYAIYDQLIDNGYTLKAILTDVIYEGLVVSGFLAKEELEEMKKQMATPKNTMDTVKK